MKNILVVFTGGTIGSTDGTINTEDSTSFELIRLFRQHDENHRQIHFHTIQPLRILSENLAPDAWKTLIAAIEEARPGQYDGIIITHGTDTLAYTACALSFYFNAAKIPMLLVSSVKAMFSERVLMIKPYPGLDYTRFNLDGVDAVLHDLYHSGTACASRQWGENHSLLEFIERCERQDITIYLAPAIKSADAYQSTQALIEQGADMIWNMSIEAAYVKLLLAYGNFDDKQEILDFINTDLAGEHL